MLLITDTSESLCRPGASGREVEGHICVDQTLDATQSCVVDILKIADKFNFGEINFISFLATHGTVNEIIEKIITIK